MLVFVPTREDVLSIRSIDEAFDLTTTRVRKREVALIRAASSEGLVHVTDHAFDAMEDEAIAEELVWDCTEYGNVGSKDIDGTRGRHIGLNFERSGWPARRSIRVKVSWELRYFIPTVHAL